MNIQDQQEPKTGLSWQVLDSLVTAIAVVENDGTIRAVNESWRRFSNDNGGSGSLTGVGANYFDACRNVNGKDSNLARKAMVGIQSVLNGSQESFKLEYPCHSPNEQRWFLLHVSRLKDSQRAVVAHLCITERKLVENELKSVQKEVLRIADEEGKRIGQELHDSIGQQLVGIRLLGASLAPQLEQSATVSRIVEELGSTLKQIQLLSQRLVPVEFNADGLNAAIDSFVHRINGLSDVACTFECGRDTFVFSDFCATNLYRIAQEAVANALKHSHAKNISLSLTRDNGRVSLLIEDDGVGFNQDVNRKGMGLRIMKHRADVIDASLEFAAGKNGGTVVSCVFEDAESSP